MTLFKIPTSALKISLIRVEDHNICCFFKLLSTFNSSHGFQSGEALLQAIFSLFLHKKSLNFLSLIIKIMKILLRH